MGNSFCSTCECVKGEKQNEFDDTKEQPITSQSKFYAQQKFEKQPVTLKSEITYSNSLNWDY